MLRGTVGYAVEYLNNAAGSLAGIGDVFSQLLVEDRWRKGGYEPIRTARFVGVISVWVAPILYRWFGILERVSGRPSIVPIKRMLIDQSVMAPLLTSTVITNLHLVEGNRPRDALLRARKEILPVLITNYKVWPFVQLFNFYVVPLRYRIILLQFVGIFWNAYLSYMTQSIQSANVANTIKAKEINLGSSPTSWDLPLLRLKGHEQVEEHLQNPLLKGHLNLGSSESSPTS